MDSLRAEARQDFLDFVSSESSDCHVLEIQGSGTDITVSERTINMDEVPTYLRSEADQPTLKLVRLNTRFWFGREQESPELAWVPDTIADLGLDPYFTRMLTQARKIFQASEQKTHKEGGSLNVCTKCILFTTAIWTAEDVWQYTTKFLRQNKALFQSPCLLQLSFLSMAIANTLYDTQESAADWNSLDEDTLRNWDKIRRDHRHAQREFNMCRQIACHLRERLDASKDLDSLHKDVIAANAGVRDAFNVIEPWIAPMIQDVEWVIQITDDYMARISRTLMRKDTEASIELAKLSVALTKAAKADSSSMKIIAVMTMIFLPGTFFAALFAVPSLKWDNQDVVGDKFWIYWAFTIPFTLLIIFLWLAITQRKQMKTLVEAGKRLLKMERTADEEEATEDK
ncbi:hypothetical protein Hte_000674 [Hypoxylon texense]